MTTESQARWAEVRVSEVVDSIEYGYTAKAIEGAGPRLLRITDIQNGNVDWTRVPSCEITDDDLRRYQLEPGDIVFARTGATTGKSYLIRNCPDECAFASYLIRLRPSPTLLPAYMAFFFQSTSYWRQIAEQTTGTAQPGVNATRLREIRLPLAPLPEQRRIVDAIESYFTRLDDAVATLERVQRNLERYRASVLKAAVEGRLVPTEAELARAEGRDYEPASVLLQRILAERRRCWEEAELARMKSQGKHPNDDKWKKKYKEPMEPEAADLPELPEGWSWARVESIAGKVVDGVHKKPSYVGSGVPFVTVKNLTAGPGISFQDLRYITEADHEKFVARANPGRGDLLISKDGTLGVIRAVRTDRVFSIFVSVALVKPLVSEMSDYLEIALSSPIVQRQMVPKGSGLQHIHLEDLRADCIPMPPLAEWPRICAAVHRHTSMIEALDAEVTHELMRCGRLRQSILKWAFQGKLVDQDLTDEPASMLLDRIRTERESSESKKSKNHAILKARAREA